MYSFPCNGLRGLSPSGGTGSVGWGPQLELQQRSCLPKPLACMSCAATTPCPPLRHAIPSPASDRKPQPPPKAMEGRFGLIAIYSANCIFVELGARGANMAIKASISTKIGATGKLRCEKPESAIPWPHAADGRSGLTQQMEHVRDGGRLGVPHRGVP